MTSAYGTEQGVILEVDWLLRVPGTPRVYAVCYVRMESTASFASGLCNDDPSMTDPGLLGEL